MSRTAGAAHQLDSAVKEMTDKLAKKSPVAMRLGRDSFYRQQDMEFSAALDYPVQPAPR